MKDSALFCKFFHCPTWISQILSTSVFILSFCSVLWQSGCGEKPSALLPSELDPTGSQIKLSTTVRNQRIKQISASLVTLGIKNPILIAGVASAETSFAHCYSEATYHCPGPQSTECGGPVLAGSGDGACALRQGGIGMFQFDSGSYDDTLRQYGNSILAVKGNTAAVVPFFVNKITYHVSAKSSLASSIGLPNIRNQKDFVNWVNSIDAKGGSGLEKWLKMVACFYNGACPGSSLHAQRVATYREHINSLIGSMPAVTDVVTVSEDDTSTVSTDPTTDPATGGTDPESCESQCWVEIIDPYNEEPPYVTMREEASVKSTKVGKIGVGEKVCYLNETEKNGYANSYKTLKSSTYYKVEYSGQTGWVWQPYAKAPTCTKSES